MTTRVGLIGLGYWGPNLARVIAGTADLAALCETDPDRLAKFASVYPRAQATTDAEFIFGDKSIDAVVIATPAATHYSLAHDALESGKHVLVEKPLATRSVDALELMELADTKGLVLCSGHTFLYNAAVRTVRDYIDEGSLGEIFYVYSQRLNLGLVREDVNALWNFGPHDLSILAYWLRASPARVMARGFSFLQPGVEDVAFMTLDYPSGVVANVHVSWLDPNKVRLMTIVGSERMVVYDDVSADKIKIYDKGVRRISIHDPGARNGILSFGEHQLQLRAGDVVVPRIDFREPLLVEMEDFISAIENGHRPVSDAAVGVDVVRTLEAAQRSIAQDGAPVEL